MRGNSAPKLGLAAPSADAATMSTELRVALYALVGICLIAAASRSAATSKPMGSNGGAQYRVGQAEADKANVGVLSAEQRARTFTFAPGSSPDEQRIFLNAVGSARPEARRLVDLVDGLVTVHFEQPPRADAVGLTRFDGKDYDIYIGLREVITRYGEREGGSIVLHELGHVVDIALVPDTLVEALDLDIPVGENCRRDGPIVGACAPKEERFADTFSKWAMDDLGVSLASGYRILPPIPLERWGRPLARLTS